MVFFSLTRLGYEDFVRQFGAHSSVALWVNKDVMTDSELQDAIAEHLPVTNFTRTIDIQDDDAVENATDTVRQHHANERVWVER